MAVDKRTARLALGGVAVLGLVGYLILRNKSQAQNASQGGLTGITTYDPSGGIEIGTIANEASNGIAYGNNIANSVQGSEPIGVSSNNTIINTNTGLPTSPSSWQGTTNKSGSLTYLSGELAGEGSGPLLFQGITY
jgi:acid phosphatase class B